MRSGEERRLPEGVVLLADAVKVGSAGGKPHILLLVDQFARVLGGGERVVLRTAELLVGAGYRVSIVTFAVAPECVALAGAACPVYLLPMTSVSDRNALRCALVLGRFLRRERVQIVQTYFESANLFGGIVTRLLSRAKLVWSFRDMGILRARKHRVAYRALAWMPHWVFAVSEKVRRHAIEVDGIAPDRVSVLYNGLDLQRWMADGKAAGPSVVTGSGPLVVSLGNVRRVKGHDVLVEAAALVLALFPEARFAVAGEVLEPAFFAELRIRVAALGIADSVAFLGGVTELPRLFREADVFVLPSRSEGFSNAILEAMAARLPVVATDVGGNAEAVVEKKTGHIVPAEDPGALANAIQDLLGAPERMRAMGLAGRERAEAMFTESAMRDGLESVYRMLLGGD